MSKPPSRSQYIDEFSHHMGFCNSCGEEAELGSECCEDGEVEPYEDDREPEL
jgi:hypothetical protein